MIKSFHLLGVGGIGMSALAHILLEKGETVSGSDLKDSVSLPVRLTEDLPSRGTVVYSTAIPETHPHFIVAKKEKRLLHRSELLASLIDGKKGLLVAGTHGKTSTSALLAWTLISAGRKPSYAVGGILQNLQKNGGYGKGEYFAIEADESDGSFLNYQGEGGIVTNIEKEHLDHWKNEEKLLRGFQTFMKKIRNPNLLFWCSDDPHLKQLNLTGISYGKTGELKLIGWRQEGFKAFFSATFQGKTYKDIELPLMGEKLSLNALAVFGLSLKLGLTENEIRTAFKTFQGVKRRQEKIGEAHRIALYDDYAHHPTEIQTLLESFQKGMESRRLIALFEPHRYSRTRDLFSEFLLAFTNADLTVITDIFPAGEKGIPGITGKRLAHEMQALYVPRKEVEALIPKLLIPGDVLITIGAGGITKAGPEILRKLA